MRRLLIPAIFALAFGAGIIAAVAQQTVPDSVVGGVYNLSAPALSNFQKAPLQLDTNGQLKVTGNISATLAPFAPTANSLTGSPISVSTTTSTPVNMGTAGPVFLYNSGSQTVFYAFGGVGVTATTGATPLPPGGCVSVSSTGLGQYIAAITASSTSTLYVVPGTGLAGLSCPPPSAAGGTSSGYGAAFPATGTAAGFTDGTNMQPALVDASKRLVVAQPTASVLNATVVGSGSAGTANPGVMTVQGITSMTKLLVTPDSVALPANQSVNTAQVNGVTTLTGAGATGTGSQRETVAQDTTTIAGSAPGTAGSASANVVTVQGVTSMTKLLVTPDSVALPANQSVNLSQVNGTTVLVNTGAVGTGAQRVAVGTDTATIAGSAPGTAGTPSANVLSVQGASSMTPILATQTPATTGGLSVARTILANNTTSVAVKASAGQVFHIDAQNNSATVNGYLKIYNIAQGSNTCGSNTPIISVMVPFGSGIVMDNPNGFAFGTAISVCYTAAIADNDTTAPAASSGLWNIGYK